MWVSRCCGWADYPGIIRGASELPNALIVFSISCHHLTKCVHSSSFLASGASLRKLVGGCAILQVSGKSVIVTDSNYAITVNCNRASSIMEMASPIRKQRNL